MTSLVPALRLISAMDEPRRPTAVIDTNFGVRGGFNFTQRFRNTLVPRFFGVCVACGTHLMEDSMMIQPAVVNLEDVGKPLKAYARECRNCLTPYSPHAIHFLSSEENLIKAMEAGGVDLFEATMAAPLLRAKVDGLSWFLGKLWEGYAAHGDLIGEPQDNLLDMFNFPEDSSAYQNALFFLADKLLYLDDMTTVGAGELFLTETERDTLLTEMVFR